jgi:DNA-binding transcriptional ArsR family regulator
LDARLELLLHPVRLRLVHALRLAGRLTTGELCARLPDLPKATVYRQVAKLADGGVFQVESERKVRGVMERLYRLDVGAANVSALDAARMTIEDHRQGFTAAMTALMADFSGYLDRDGANPLDDEVSYRQFVLWLTEEERSRLVTDLGRTVLGAVRHPMNEGRSPFILSTVFFPAG